MGYLDSGGGVFGLSFLFEPVAVAADVDDGGPVEQAIKRGGGHDGVVGEDLAPVGEGFVAGQDDGVPRQNTIRAQMEPNFDVENCFGRQLST